MKINKENDLIEFIPENETETGDLSNLWNVMIDCVKFNKKLVPIGEYVPEKKNVARFAIED